MWYPMTACKNALTILVAGTVRVSKDFKLTRMIIPHVSVSTWQAQVCSISGHRA